MDNVSREMTFMEEATLYREEAKELLNANGKDDDQISVIMRRGMRITRKARDEINALKTEVEQLRKERNTNTVIHCSDCDHYRAQTIIDGEPHNYVCCRTNGYSPSEKHYCAWAERSVIPMRWRYTAACTARYVEGETINGIQSETDEGKK